METRPVPRTTTYPAARAADAIRATVASLHRRGIELPDGVSFTIRQCANGELVAMPRLTGRRSVAELRRRMERRHS